MIGVETRPDRPPASVPPPAHTPHTHTHTHTHTLFVPPRPSTLMLCSGLRACAGGSRPAPPQGFGRPPSPLHPTPCPDRAASPARVSGRAGPCVRACLRVSARACVARVPACVCASALRGQGCRGRRRPSACRRGRVLWRMRAVRGDGGGQEGRLRVAALVLDPGKQVCGRLRRQGARAFSVCNVWCKASL